MPIIMIIAVFVHYTQVLIHTMNYGEDLCAHAAQR